MVKDELIISYTPSEDDYNNLNEIRDFLNEMEIPFVESDVVFGMFTIRDIKGNDIELRYISSLHYPMDLSKRFGEDFKGVPKEYFMKISQRNYEENNIRTIWIFDFEMKQKSDLKTVDGTIIKDYRRQWEVMKNTIRTATGHIFHRFYARDCEICIVDNSELRPFLQENCFYGYRSANVNLGLRLKKDKNGFKAGTLLFVYTFGMCFYGNKKHQHDPKVEIIRVATKLGCQVIGGSSKSLLYFLKTCPTLKVDESKKDVKVDELIFFVDASHLDGRSMNALGFTFLNWDTEGFMNIFTEDIDEIYERPDGKKVRIRGNKGDVQQRKPAAHRRIMVLIEEKKIISVGNAGTSVYHIFRNEYLQDIVVNSMKDKQHSVLNDNDIIKVLVDGEVHVVNELRKDENGNIEMRIADSGEWKPMQECLPFEKER